MTDQGLASKGIHDAGSIWIESEEGWAVIRGEVADCCGDAAAHMTCVAWRTPSRSWAFELGYYGPDFFSAHGKEMKSVVCIWHRGC